MKRLFLAGTLLIAGSLVAVNANSMDGNLTRELRKERREKRRELWLHTPDIALSSRFGTDFPDATNVNWTHGAFAEATFFDADHILRTAYYDSENNLVGTTTKVDVKMLPAKAKKYIDRKYPGYSVQQLILFDDNEANDSDMVLFNHSFSDEDTYFPVLSNGVRRIILKVTPGGSVSFFRNYE